MKTGILRFPGSCDEVDAQLAASLVGETVLLWHGDRDLQDVDAVIVPGGVVIVMSTVAVLVFGRSV